MDDLIEVLAGNACAGHLDDLLITLAVLQERLGKPGVARLLALARAALMERWAPSTATGVLAAHGTANIFDDVELVREIIAAAGPIPISIGVRRLEPRPDALIRLYDVANDRMVDFLRAEMTSPGARNRLHAAMATRYLRRARPAAAAPLVPALLDALELSLARYRDRGSDAVDVIAHTLADVIAEVPGLVDVEVERRWSSATAPFRLAVMSSYDWACRNRLSSDLSHAAATSVARRALTAVGRISEFDLIRRAADTLKLVCGYFPRQVELPLVEMMEALAKLSKPPASAPNAPADAIGAAVERLATAPYLVAAADDAVHAIASLAWVRPTEFWPVCEQVWERSVNDRPLRLHLIDLVTLVGVQPDIPAAAAPMLESLLREDVTGKATILSRVAKLKWPAERQLPEVFAGAIIDSLMSNDLVLIEPAIEAVRVTKPAEADLHRIVTRLAHVAGTLASDFRLRRLVGEAITSLQVLAKDSSLEDLAAEQALEAIGRMPAFYAGDVLWWRYELLSHPKWLETAVHCLAPEEDWSYWDLGREHRMRLAREIARKSPAAVAPHVPALVTSATTGLPRNLPWAWYVADVLSYLGFYQEAVGIAAACHAAVPDSPEQRLTKLTAEQVLANHEFEAGVDRGDDRARDAAAGRWRLAIAQEAEEMRDDPDARRLLPPPFLAD